MAEFKQFLIQNWYLIAVVVLCIALFIVSLFKNKNLGLVEKIKASLLEQLPIWIILSEQFNTGEAKMNNVLALGLALVSKMLGRALTADENTFFESFIREQAEKILSAPQKKLKTAEITKKSKYTV